MEQAVINIFLHGVVPLITAVIGIIVAIKLKIGPTTDRLITLLQSTVSAQEKQIVDLQNRLNLSEKKIIALEARAKELEETIVAQEVEITRLTNRAKRVVQRGASNE